EAEDRRHLEVVWFEEKSNSLSNTFSGGMRKRLIIAMATLLNPKVIMLDEPSTGMNPETRREMWDLFLSMRHKCSYIISTHNLEEWTLWETKHLSYAKVRCFAVNHECFSRRHSV
ncbi:ABC transporter, putative, partial [Ixodes scapularis]